MKLHPAFVRPALLTLIVMACSGCATYLPVAQSESNPQARFAEYKTFAVLPPGGPGDRVDKGDYVRLSGSLRGHLETQLQARGLKSVSTEDADITFEVVGAVTPEVTYTPGPARVNYRWGWYTRYPLHGYYTMGSVVETVERGVLSVIAYDRKAKVVAWAAWMEGSYSPGVREETVRQAIDALIAKFPAK